MKTFLLRVNEKHRIVHKLFNAQLIFRNMHSVGYIYNVIIIIRSRFMLLLEYIDDEFFLLINFFYFDGCGM